MKVKHAILLLIMLLCVAISSAIDSRFLTKISHTASQPAFSIATDGDKVITRNQNQVWIYSVFNPWQPQIDASYYSVFPIEDVDVMAGRYLHICSREAANSLLEVDSLNVYGKIYFPSLFVGDKMEREGSTLYLADLQRGIEIIDIGSGGMRETKSVFSEKWGIKDFLAEYPYIYAINEFGVVTVDMSDLRNPQSIGVNYEITNASILAKNGDLLWVGAGKSLLALNIRDLNRPTLVNQYRFAYDVLDLEIKDNRAYVALGFGGVRIMDISNPMRLDELNWINLPSSAMSIALEKDFIFIGSGNSGWYIFEYR